MLYKFRYGINIHASTLGTYLPSGVTFVPRQAGRQQVEVVGRKAGSRAGM